MPYAIRSFALASLLTACGGDFAPYNLLEGLRVLAVRAEPPVLAAGDSTTLDALVWLPSSEPVTYEWSWCPFTESRDTGFECAVTAEEVQAAVDEALGPGTVTVDFDLGTDATAALAYPGDASLVRSLCEQVLARAATSVSGAISCDDGLEITVRLVASTSNDSVTVVKRVPLVLEPSAATNTNPSFGPGVRIAGKRDRDEALAAELALDGSDLIAAGSKYRLWVDIAEGSFETFVPPGDALEETPAPRGESLFLTWFVSAGETDATRTSFIDGETSPGDLRENVWSIAPFEEIPEQRVELVLVLRDERGGVTWRSLSIDMKERGQ
jgi:hypothetical protein